MFTVGERERERERERECAHARAARVDLAAEGLTLRRGSLRPPGSET